MKKIYFLFLAAAAIFCCSASFAQNEFITKWDTRLVSASGDPDQANATLVVGASGSGVVISYTEQGGSGVTGSLTNLGDNPTVVFPEPGVYIVKMTGLNIFNANATPAAPYANGLLEVQQWGDTHWTAMEYAFAGCKNMDITAIDAPDLSGVTSLSNLFRGCGHLVNVNASINTWDVSHVTNMFAAFYGASIFNQPLGQWDVSSVTDMGFMFRDANLFNQNINGWDVSHVNSLTQFFADAAAFNQPLDQWDVSHVKDFSFVFYDAAAFNQDLSSWDVSKGETFEDMFEYAISFNQNLGNWNLTSATTLYSMFKHAGLNCTNYDNILIGWAANPNTPDNLEFGASEIGYDLRGEAAHNTLQNTKGWMIDDAGLDPGCDATLPIRLMAGSFKAVTGPDGVLLSWKTATEINAKGFTVQRSLDGIAWVSIGDVGSKADHGFSQKTLAYDYVDRSAAAGRNYYRLIQTDLTDKETFSDVIDIVVAGEAGKLRLYPSPATSHINLQAPAAGNLKIYNMAGVLVKMAVVKAGNNYVSLEGLGSGVYIARLNNQEVKFIKK